MYIFLKTLKKNLFVSEKVLYIDLNENEMILFME